MTIEGQRKSSQEVNSPNSPEKDNLEGKFYRINAGHTERFFEQLIGQAEGMSINLFFDRTANIIDSESAEQLYAKFPENSLQLRETYQTIVHLKEVEGWKFATNPKGLIEAIIPFTAIDEILRFNENDTVTIQQLAIIESAAQQIGTVLTIIKGHAGLVLPFFDKLNRNSSRNLVEKAFFYQLNANSHRRILTKIVTEVEAIVKALKRLDEDLDFFTTFVANLKSIAIKNKKAYELTHEQQLGELPPLSIDASKEEAYAAGADYYRMYLTIEENLTTLSELVESDEEGYLKAFFEKVGEFLKNNHPRNFDPLIAILNSESFAAQKKALVELKFRTGNLKQSFSLPDTKAA